MFKLDIDRIPNDGWNDTVSEFEDFVWAAATLALIIFAAVLRSIVGTWLG